MNSFEQEIKIQRLNSNTEIKKILEKYTENKSMQVGGKYLEAMIEEQLIDKFLPTSQHIEQRVVLTIIDLAKLWNINQNNVRSLVFRLYETQNYKEIANIKGTIKKIIKEYESDVSTNITILTGETNKLELLSMLKDLQEESRTMQSIQLNSTEQYNTDITNFSLPNASTKYPNEKSILCELDEQIQKYLQNLSNAKSQLNFLAQHFALKLSFDDCDDQSFSPKKLRKITLNGFNSVDEKKFKKLQYIEKAEGSNKKDAETKAAYKILVDIYSNNQPIWLEMQSKIKKGGIKH